MRRKVFSAAESYFSEILKGYETCGKSSLFKEQRGQKVRFKRREKFGLICPVLLEAWLGPTIVSYHRNVSVSILLNQWLPLTMLRATDPWTTCMPI